MKALFMTFISILCLNTLANDTQESERYQNTAQGIKEVLIGGSAAYMGTKISEDAMITEVKLAFQQNIDYLVFPNKDGVVLSPKEIKEKMLNFGKKDVVTILIKPDFDEAKEMVIQNLEKNAQKLNFKIQEAEVNEETSLAKKYRSDLDNVTKLSSDIKSDLKAMSPEDFKKKYQNTPEFNINKSNIFDLSQKSKDELESFLKSSMKRGDKLIALGKKADISKVHRRKLFGLATVLGGFAMVGHGTYEVLKSELAINDKQRDITKDESEASSESSKSVASVFGHP